MDKKQEEITLRLAEFRKEIETKDQTTSEMANKLKCSQGRIDLNENLIKGIKIRKKTTIIKIR